MSIESTSVPNPVVREIENNSRRNAWSETQGSGTGSKDGQFSSFWDKAFTGAQRLLGIDSSSNQETIEGEGLEVENQERKHAQRKRFAEKRLDATPGFGSSGFHRLTASLRRESPPGLAMLSSSDRLKGLSSESSSSLDEAYREDRLRESAAIEENFDHWDDDLEEDADDEEKQAKTADPPVLAPPPFAKNPSNKNQSALLGADNQALAMKGGSVGINSAEQVAMTNSQASESMKETASEAMSPVEALEAVSYGGIRRTVSGESQGSGIESSASRRSAIIQEGETSKQSLIPAKKAQPNVPTGHKVSESSHEGSGKDADSLLIDSDKAKRTLSSFLDGARSASSSKNVSSISSGSIQSQASVVAAGQEVGTSEKESGVESNNKSVDTSKGAASKNLSNSSARADAAKPLPGSFDHAVSESSASRKGTRPSGGNSTRFGETRSISGNSSRPVNGSTTSANGLNVTRGATASEPSVQGRLGDSSLKNMANAKMTSSQGESVKTANLSSSAPKSEGAQAVQLSGSDVSETRKATFTPKAQVLNYSSKSTEETSEVYKALSKSVDRLTTGKSDTISIRLNFDQGGTMALRVSIDSGQINAAMQTDLPGLESLIKASWSEFATELNQKGLKIGSPQFSQFENETLKNENPLNFDQKGSQSKGESSNDARSGRSRGASNSGGKGADASTSERSQNSEGSPDSDQELETYA